MASLFSLYFMEENYMKINFKEIIGTVSKFGEDHKPEIATGAGITLMVAGTVGAIIATVKTMQKVADAKEAKLKAIAADAEEYENLSEEEQQEYDDICNNPMPVKEVVPIVWKYWVGPFFAHAVGGVCLIFSNRESSKRIGLLTTALTSHLAEAKDYKEAVKELVGEKKEDEIAESQVKKTVQKRAKSVNFEKGVIDTGTGEQYYQDYYTGAILKASPAYIEACLNELNALINEKCNYLPRDNYDLFMKNDVNACYVTMSEWANILSLDIQTTGLTDMFGFDVTQGLAQLSCSNADLMFLDNARSCAILHFRSGNVPNYIDV